MFHLRYDARLWSLDADFAAEPMRYQVQGFRICEQYGSAELMTISLEIRATNPEAMRMLMDAGLGGKTVKLAYDQDIYQGRVSALEGRIQPNRPFLDLSMTLSDVTKELGGIC